MPESGPAGGRAITGPDGGRVPIAGVEDTGDGGVEMIFGPWRGWGTILRGSGFSAAAGAVTTRGGCAATGGTPGRATLVLADGPVLAADEAGGRTTTVGATAAGGADAGLWGY